MHDKTLESHNYFQYININIVFLLNKFLFYMQKTIQYLLDDYKIKEIMSFFLSSSLVVRAHTF